MKSFPAFKFHPAMITFYQIIRPRIKKPRSRHVNGLRTLPPHKATEAIVKASVTGMFHFFYMIVNLFHLNLYTKVRTCVLHFINQSSFLSLFSYSKHGCGLNILGSKTWPPDFDGLLPRNSRGVVKDPHTFHP